MRSNFHDVKFYGLYLKMRFLIADCFTNGKPSHLKGKKISKQLKFLVNN